MMDQDPGFGAMSNYSVYFLRQNGHLNTNCLVYSLTLGLIKYQDYSTSQWLGNITDFLPAYYVTNCLIPDLWSQIASQNVSQSDITQWLEEYRENPYNNADNGDSFVALLFMLVGSCVLCWMLTLLFLLLPKHKRKPVLTQLAVLCYLVYLTVVFSKVAVITEDEYYADSLDMVRIYLEMYDRRYSIFALCSIILTQCAYFELFWRMTKPRWQMRNAAIVALLIVGCIVSGATSFPHLADPAAFVAHSSPVPGVVFLVFEIAFMLWFALALAHYTLHGTATPPKQVAYSRKLLPMAILTWLFLVIYVVIALLLLTYWRIDWLINSWLYLVPKLLCMYILTAAWEWYDSIRHLELQLEIVDMLGRRISLEDVMDFNNDVKVKRTALRGRFAPLLDLVRRRKPLEGADKDDDSRSRDMFSATTTSTSVTPVVVDCGNAGEHPDPRHSMESSEYEVQYMDTDSWEGDGNDYNEDRHISLGRRESVEEGVDSLRNQTSVPAPNPNLQASIPIEGSSSAQNITNISIDEEPSEELPPFRPHPGFSKDDYWDEK